MRPRNCPHDVSPHAPGCLECESASLRKLTEKEQQFIQAMGANADVPCFGWRCCALDIDELLPTCPRHGCKLVPTTAGLMTEQWLCPMRELSGFVGGPK